jgi:hypothetical protein
VQFAVFVWNKNWPYFLCWRRSLASMHSRQTTAMAGGSVDFAGAVNLPVLPVEKTEFNRL